MKQDTETRSLNTAWHAPSLRGRITFLAATVVVLLTVTLCILVWVLRSTQANTVGPLSETFGGRRTLHGECL